MRNFEVVAFWSIILIPIGFLLGLAFDRISSPTPSQLPSFNFSVVENGRPVQLNSSWSFFAADYNRDGVLDLWVIKQQNTGTNSTEIHILNGKNPQEFLLQTGTALHETPNVIKVEKE